MIIYINVITTYYVIVHLSYTYESYVEKILKDCVWYEFPPSQSIFNECLFKVTYNLSNY